MQLSSNRFRCLGKRFRVTYRSLAVHYIALGDGSLLSMANIVRIVDVNTGAAFSPTVRPKLFRHTLIAKKK
jgi:hypothetical protein